MRKLRYSINVTLDGCVDHRAIVPDEELHRYHAESLKQADALLYGRVTYQMMEEGWRKVAETGVAGEGMPDWVVPFAKVIDVAKKHVVSNTLPSVDWNADLIRGEGLREAVLALKQQPGRELLTGGVTLPLALAEMGLIDVFDLLVLPHIAGHGPRLMDGLSRGAPLKLVERRELASGALALKYLPA